MIDWFIQNMKEVQVVLNLKYRKKKVAVELGEDILKIYNKGPKILGLINTFELYCKDKMFEESAMLIADNKYELYSDKNGHLFHIVYRVSKLTDKDLDECIIKFSKNKEQSIGDIVKQFKLLQFKPYESIEFEKDHIMYLNASDNVNIVLLQDNHFLDPDIMSYEAMT